MEWIIKLGENDSCWRPQTIHFIEGTVARLGRKDYVTNFSGRKGVENI